jgi:UPF0755 protein
MLPAAFIGGRELWQQNERKKWKALFSRTWSVDASVRIPSGATLRDIAVLSVAVGAPVSETEFIDLATRQQVSTKLRSGRYRFAAGDNMEKTLADMVVGNVIAERFTIVEGTTIAQVRKKLAADERLQNDIKNMNDNDIHQALDINQSFLEGLFLPETYFFEEDDKALNILRRSHRNMKKTLNSLWAKRNDNNLLSTPEDALILASIVEKETGVAEERPLIASVFVNRLRRGIPLQADPTVIYGLGESFNGNLTRKHLRDKSNSYNTYAHRGLPPTPIALPGKAAIESVLNPPDTAYYYFVATGDGRHVFSETLRAHNNAVNKYQRRQKR